MKKIATGETEKSEVVRSSLALFKDKFLKFRENIERVSRYCIVFFQTQLNLDYSTTSSTQKLWSDSKYSDCWDLKWRQLFDLAL